MIKRIGLWMWGKRGKMKKHEWADNMADNQNLDI